MVKRIVEHPDLELVGLHCYSTDKVGRDAGEIVGIAPIGVVATADIADVLRAKPDVVNFNGVWPDIDMFCALLGHGVNIVTTSDWITGYHRDRNHPHPSGKRPTGLIEAACQRGGATFYGTGMNPGLAQILSVVATAGMDGWTTSPCWRQSTSRVITRSTPGRTSVMDGRSMTRRYPASWGPAAPSSPTRST
jgi:4-hydroxy-tetrahydrodipicolinate reductase